MVGEVAGEGNEVGRRVCNDKQYEAVLLVARRVQQELLAASDPAADFGEPVRWLLHGGPGTGKSHVVKLVKELFTEVLKWDIGVQFQVVALQAVMADLLGGDTIHHACGIPVMQKQGGEAAHQQSHMEIAQKVLQWRWLIIDDIYIGVPSRMPQRKKRPRLTCCGRSPGS